MRTLLLFLLLLPATLLAQIQDSNSPRFRLYGGKLEVQSAPNLPWAGVVTGTLSNAASYSALQNASTDLVNYDGSLWDRVAGTPSTTLGHGYVTTPASNGSYMKRRVAGNIYTADMWQLVGDGTTNNLTNFNRSLAYIAATGGGTLTGTASKTYVVGGSLVVGDNTTVRMYGATVRELDNTNVNLLRTAANVAGSGRTKNVIIEGGVWDRGNNGGVGANNHTLLLRQVDNLTIRDVKVLTPQSITKYAISLGDVTNAVCRSIRFENAGSDGLHLQGPSSHILIDDVTGQTHDDLVALTTLDYAIYADVQGDISDVTIRNVVANNGTRAVLLNANAYNLTDITVQGVVQTGAGDGVAVTDGTGEPLFGTPSVTGSIDRVSITDVRGGAVRIKHQTLGSISVSRVTAPGNAVSFAAGGTSPATGSVKKALISDITSNSASTSLIYVDNRVSVDQLTIADCRQTHAGSLFSVSSPTIGKLMLRNCVAQPSADFTPVNLAGATVGTVNMTDCVLGINTSNTSVKMSSVSSSTIGAITYVGCSFSATNSNSGDVVSVDGASSIGVITVANSSLSGNARVVDRLSGTNSTVINLSNLRCVGVNRLVQSGSPVEVAYNNVRFESGLNAPFRIFNSQTMNVRGAGFSGWTNSAVARAGSEVINVVAPDLPCDPALVATTNGNAFYAVNNAVAVAIGPVIADGNSWISPITQPRVLASISGINALTTGQTNLYTVPSGRVAVITGVTIRTTTSTAITAPATVEVGVDGTSNNVFPSQALTGLTFQEGTFPLASTSARRQVPTGSVVKLNITTGATGTAQTWTVEVVGYLR